MGWESWPRDKLPAVIERRLFSDTTGGYLRSPGAGARGAPSQSWPRSGTEAASDACGLPASEAGGCLPISVRIVPRRSLSMQKTGMRARLLPGCRASSVRS